jgi:isoleucyl-tRNA synthetase
LRNTLRYQLSNLYDFDPERHAVASEKLDGLDRWILAQFARLEDDVRQAYDRYEFHVVYQRVSQFAAVELSAVYHDIVKDRLYTDAANSPRRRSTQTALWRLARGLCGLLSPILSFTTDEAWEFIPKSGAESVHLAIWTPEPFVLDAREDLSWKQLFELREAALPKLEEARQAKTIGKALEAKIKLSGIATALPSGDHDFAALRELLNVSQLVVQPRDSGPLEISVSQADGAKCERCWHWEKDVGSNSNHPTICARCVNALPPIS